MVKARGSADCPICGRLATLAAKPFCSRRCADVDLGRWLTGQYRVPGPPAEPEEEFSGSLDDGEG